jgi:hypothetical protein
MAARRPRGGGYYNAALAVAGAAVALPVGANSFTIHVSAPCYVGIASSASLLTFNTTNYGVMGAGQWEEFTSQRGGGTERYVHVAPVTGTAIVSITFL